MREQYDILDLFDRLQYPADPGHRATDTSMEAAKAMRTNKARLQELVLDALAAGGPMTSHEIAYRTGEAYGSIQPRTAELSIEKRIRDSGERRMTPSGRKSIVWKLTQP